MRKELEEKNNERINAIGIFERFGKKSTGFQGRTKTTVLLKDIRDEDGKLLTDHLWFDFIKGFQKLNLEKGDIISFSGRVNIYKKGNVKHIWIPDDTTEEEDEYYEYCCDMVDYSEEMEPDEDEYLSYQEFYDFIYCYQSCRTL